MRAAQVSVQPVLAGRQVSGGGGAGGRGEELHGGGVVGGARAGVHPWTTNKDICPEDGSKTESSFYFIRSSFQVSDCV